MNIKAKLQTLNSKVFLPGLDVIALIAWGALLFKYWLTGQLSLLIHPNYFWLVFVTSLILLGLGIAKASQLLTNLRRRKTRLEAQDLVQHITLFPLGWASGLLTVAAIASFAIPPTVLTSQVALQRGVTESLPVTRVQVQSFRGQTKPEERSLIEWIRTLNAYPEPDAYAGQKAKVSGFVIHLPQLPDDYLLISRFILTCCAVDAYPVGLPVKLESSRDAYPPDTWLEIEGEMMTETLAVDSQTMKETTAPKRQLVLVAKSVKKIPTPADPYGY